MVKFAASAVVAALCLDLHHVTSFAPSSLVNVMPKIALKMAEDDEGDVVMNKYSRYVYVDVSCDVETIALALALLCVCIGTAVVCQLRISDNSSHQ